MHHNLLLAWLATFYSVSFKKAANQANSKLWCINYTSYAFKKIVYFCFVCWSSTQPCWYIFSSSDFTLLSCSVTCTFLALPFLQQRCFWDRIPHLFRDKKNTCMYLVCINCLFRGGLYIQVPFKTGSTVIAHHKNNNVLISLKYNQLTSVSWRNLPFIFFYTSSFFIYVCNIKTLYVLYNICFC